jgi:acyl-CoA-dependent ceramide synthase
VQKHGKLTKVQTSKVLNYIDSVFTATYFTIFLFVWAYLRHWINLTVIWSLRPGGQFSTVGPYELDWENQQYKCTLSQVITAILLIALQAVNVFWFSLVLRILWRIITSGEKKDDRSDDEDEEELEELQKGNGTAKPMLQLNGDPMSPVAEVASLGSGFQAKGGLKSEEPVKRRK